jgi:hypothetical protein
MERWGQPARIRVDNGMPWGTQSVVPSALALWMVGLGIQPVYGRPAQSTDNAIVERSHGTLVRWVEPERCANFDVCQQQVAWAAETQRERYPALAGHSRAQAFPNLFTNTRRYKASEEDTEWEMERVAIYLSQFIFRRKVEAAGQVTLFSNTYSVGRAYSRLEVEVHLDLERYEWVFRDDNGKELRRLPSRELDQTKICQLQLGKRRKP